MSVNAQLRGSEPVIADEPADNAASSRRKSYVASPFAVGLILCAAALAFSLYWLLQALQQPILEAHGFRQTQTALTVYYYIKEGIKLDYLTPVIGQNWAIPFEFPIYQILVAAVVNVTHAPLDSAGRIVSWVFMCLCCGPLYLSLRRLGAPAATCLLCVALVMGAPEYVFWSGTFMIETTALFFTLCFVFYALRILQKRAKTLDYLLGALFLTLGLLQKVTTILPVAMMFSLLVAVTYLRPATIFREWRPIAASAAMVLLGVALMYVWTVHSDLVKTHNPIGATMMSSKLLQWNFGTLSQRLSSQLWSQVLYERVFRGSVFGATGAVAILCGIVLAPQVRMRWTIAIATLAGLSQFLIFTNLHIIHDYYQVSATLYFLIAVGLSVGALAEKFAPGRPLLFALAAIALVGANFFGFGNTYASVRRIQMTTSNTTTLNISEFIKSATAQDDVVVWYGFDWSSEVAYYSQRKSLTVPDWGNTNTDWLDHRETYLDKEPAAVVVRKTAQTERFLPLIRAKYPDAQVQDVGTCEVFLIRLARP